MKKDLFNLRRSRWLLFTLLALVMGASPTRADELTIANGTTKNSYIPFNGQNADYGIKGEYIIPASSLSDMNGMTVKSMKLYAATNHTSQKPNYGPFQVFLKEVENATPYSSSSSAFQGMDGATVVYEGNIVISSNEMLITFTSDYTYNGGNLLIGFYKDKGGYYLSNEFYGVNQDGYTANSTYNSSGISNISTGTGRTFIPKTTFTYESASPYKKPATLLYSDVTSNSAVINWTAGSGDSSETGWDLEYKTSDSDTWTEVHGLSASTLSYTLTALTDYTTYDVRVRALYGENESAWKTNSFKTPKAPITSFPWSEDFNSLTTAYTIPDGWDNSEGTTTTNNYKWWFNTNTSSNGATKGTGHDGNCICFNSYNNSSNLTNFLKTPAMNFPAGAAMQLKFWYKNPKGGDFSVYISNDGGATYTTSLATGLTGASSWTEKVIDIPSEFVNNVVIVFKATSNYGSGDAYIYLDDVLVKENAAYAMSVSGEYVVGNTIAFGEVKNTSTTKTFTISNDGASTLTGVSVVSSDESVFTVSETGFDIAAGETKDIIVTFVKGVVGEYSETVTISQANIANDAVLNITGSYAIPSAAVMAVKVGEEAIGETVTFGNVGKHTTKAITISNTGEADLVISNITSSNTTDFTVSPSSLTVQGGSSQTFTVTFLYDENALNVEKTADITITASNEGIDPVTFAVTGTRIEQWSEDFSGNALPDGWETTNTTYWTFADGVAKGKYSYSAYYLITPSLKVESTTDVLTFDYEATGNYVTINVQMSKNGGDWESCTLTPAVSSINTGVSGSTSITGLEAGNYKFRFKADDYNLDNFQGFKRNLNDPKLGIYSDAECTAAVATSVTKNFGFATETQTATYYIKNDGTGTMNLSLGENPDGITASLDKTSVTAGEHATLTITMPAENKGYNGGNVVVTATDLGTFTVAASGVIVDENKLYLDFTTANIPSTWTTGDWTKSNYGYIENSNYTSSSIETSELIATAGEEIIIEADMYTTSYTLGVNYRKIGDEEWSTLIPASNVGVSWTLLRATIEEAGTYQLQFVGARAQIRRIYGLTMPMEPVMAVYDGENLAGDAFNFGNVTNDADAVKIFTVKNEGLAELTGLDAVLSGDNAAHYSVEVSATTIAAGESATVTVKQLKDNFGAHTATLTISATDLEDKVIALSGNTRDASKMFADFESGIPEGWTANGWSSSSANGNYFMQAASSGTNTLTLPILSVAANEELAFDLSKQYNYSTPLAVRYTTNGGVDWTETDLSSYLTYGNFSTKTLSLGNTDAATTALIQFVGNYYARLDNFYGGTVTTAPVIALTEAGNAVGNGSTKEFGTLTSEPATATYTLSNTGTANLVSTLSKTGDITFEVTAMDEGVTQSENTLTIPAGKTATVVVTMPYATPFGEKSGTLNIASEGWVADVTVNFTATTFDPTAIAYNFNDNKRPSGWYVSNNGNGFSFSNGNAKNSSTEQVIITEKMVVTDAEDVLTYDAVVSASWAVSYSSLTVSYSTDRVNWTPVAEQPTGITTTATTFQVKGLAAGEYYLQFKGAYIAIDNIFGWHKISPVAEHDLYLVSSTIPTAAVIPSTSITASISVASLCTNETVAAELWMQKGVEDAVKVAELTAQTINNGATKAFALTGNVPSAEGTYQTWATVYNANGTVTTDKVDVEVAHTRTLNITDFARYQEEGEADVLTADNENQISAAFDVTVQNTGTTALTPIIKIKQGETVVGTATAAEAIDAEASTTIRVTATNMSAGEGGTLSFTAEAYWSAEENATAFPYATPVEISVIAAAPKFALYQAEEAVTDGDAVAFGLVKEATTKTFTIKNEGNAPLEALNFVAPTGYEVELAPLGTTNADWMLYFYSETGNLNGDAGIFKTTATENIFVLENINISYQGINFSVHNGGWSTQYGWSEEGGSVSATGYACKLASAENATGWLNLPVGNYDVIWNAADMTITFYKTGLVAAGDERNVNITLLAEQGKVTGDLVFTYKVDANTNNTFTLALEGQSIAVDTWIETFDTAISADWSGDISSSDWQWNSTHKAAYSSNYNYEHELISPRLAATSGEKLTFDVDFAYDGYNLKAEYSTDKKTWTEIGTYEYADRGTKVFTAPADGNYYLKFTATRYALIDNLIGFRLNPLEHDTEIASSNIPTTGTQYADYTATVRLKENLNKAEEVTAKLYVDGEAVATRVETITAKSTTTVTLTWEPQEVIDAAVKAYIEVTYAGGTLTTDEVDLTIVAPYTLDETEGTVVAGTYPALLLNRTFDAGWNTVCLPFDVEETNVETMFGEGTKVYTFNNYTEGNLNFNETTSLSAGIPYIIYVKNAINAAFKVKNATISNLNASAGSVYQNGAYFYGSYAPMAAGSLEGKYGVTGEGKIAKGTATTTMQGFRGYLSLPNGANARLVFFDADGTTTSIMAVELDKQNTENIYNLQGQKMNKTQQNGLYIINGKKVVIKK